MENHQQSGEVLNLEKYFPHEDEDEEEEEEDDWVPKTSTTKEERSIVKEGGGTDHWKSALPPPLNGIPLLQSFDFITVPGVTYDSAGNFVSTTGKVKHGCQMAVARFLECMCLALRASGVWLRYAALQNLIPSFPWIAPPPALHPGAIHGEEGIKFCHLATMR